MIEACRPHSWAQPQRMVLKAVGKMIVFISKLLIVGDSVMGCLVEAPGDGEASPDVVFCFN
jgi:hypothetical protein